MPKLNQVIAIEKGIKSRVVSEIDVLDKAIQKPDLFNGFSKTYESLNAEGDKLPPEKKRVQYVVGDILRTVSRLTSEMIDVTARKDWANCHAKADVTVNGVVLLPKVPVTHLLFLEKQLTDLRTFFDRLPVLDEGEEWSKDPNSGLMRTEVAKTHRTKKIAKPIVLIPPTVEHPGQAQMVAEDVIEGYWSNTKLSGAMPKPDRAVLVSKAESLLKAVKEAREAANAAEVSEPPTVGKAVFDFLLGE